MDLRHVEAAQDQAFRLVDVRAAEARLEQHIEGGASQPLARHAQHVLHEARAYDRRAEGVRQLAGGKEGGFRARDFVIGKALELEGSGVDRAKIEGAHADGGPAQVRGGDADCGRCAEGFGSEGRHDHAVRAFRNAHGPGPRRAADGETAETEAKFGRRAEVHQACIAQKTRVDGAQHLRRAACARPLRRLRLKEDPFGENPWGLRRGGRGAHEAPHLLGGVGGDRGGQGKGLLGADGRVLRRLALGEAGEGQAHCAVGVERVRRARGRGDAGRQHDLERCGP